MGGCFVTKTRAGSACPTGERRYRDRTEAGNALVTARRKAGPIKVLSRITPCVHCLGYHLTGQPPHPR
jgi:hypothetical protein